MDFIACVERMLRRNGNKNFLLSPENGHYLADVTGLETDFDFKPATPLEQGIAKFVDWYRDYYQV